MSREEAGPGNGLRPKGASEWRLVHTCIPLSRAPVGQDLIRFVIHVAPGIRVGAGRRLWKHARQPVGWCAADIRRVERSHDQPIHRVRGGPTKIHERPKVQGNTHDGDGHHCVDSGSFPLTPNSSLRRLDHGNDTRDGPGTHQGGHSHDKKQKVAFERRQVDSDEEQWHTECPGNRPAAVTFKESRSQIHAEGCA